MICEFDFTEQLEIVCCKRPEIGNMDYNWHSPDDWYNPQKRIHRFCSKCLTHWFGAPGQVKQYTRSEWDTLIST